MSAAQEARIKFPHVFTTFQYSLSGYDVEHFDSALPLVCGHVALWGFHIQLMRALSKPDMASVAVLVQAALCAPIEGVVAETADKLSIVSMAKSDQSRIQHEYLKNSFPAFACKLMVALQPVGTGVFNRLEYCKKQNIEQ